MHKRPKGFKAANTAGEMASRRNQCLIVLEIRDANDSLRFRAYEELVGGDTLVGWAVSRLRSSTAGECAICILAQPPELDRLKVALRRHDHVLVHPCMGLGQTDDLKRIQAITSSSRFLLADVATSLLPSALISLLVNHHLDAGNHATVLRGTPCSGPPVMLENKVLSILDRGVPGLPGTSIPNDVRRALAGLERIAQMTGSPLAKLRLEQISPLSDDEMATRRWPYSIRIATSSDVILARSVVERCTTTAGASPRSGDNYLDKWTTVACELHAARIAGLKRRVTPPATDRPSILYVQSPSAFTGVERVAALLGKGIVEQQRFRCVALIAEAGVFTEQLAAAGVDVTIAYDDFSENSVHNYLYSRCALHDFNPCVVHAHSLIGAPFCFAVAERDIPFVQHVHVAAEASLLGLQEQTLLASRVIAVSEFVKSKIVRLGVDPGRVVVIPNGTVIPEQSASRDATRSRARRRLEIPEGASVVLVVSRLAANKRVDIAIDAFAAARPYLDNPYLLIAGEAYAADAPVRESLARRVTRLRLDSRVRFLGFQPDMRTLYAAADVLLHASENDPLPMAVLEAMAHEIPVVAAWSGGNPEMVLDGVTGRLLQPGDVNGFAMAVREILADDVLRSELTRTALARCRAEFSIGQFVQQVSSVYDELLSSMR